MSGLLHYDVSFGGGVITIFGNNFSADIFDFDTRMNVKPNIGNRVSSMRFEVTKQSINEVDILIHLCGMKS